jgi:hypothetical protein
VIKTLELDLITIIWVWTVCENFNVENGHNQTVSICCNGLIIPNWGVGLGTMR